MSPRRPIAGALLVCLAVLLPGCGSDDTDGTTTEFEIDLPTPVTTVEEPVIPEGVDPNLPDSELNDLPPTPGTPQEAFENFCKENPEACG